MDTVASRVGQQYPEVKDWGIHVIDFHHTFVSDQLQTALLVLLGAVGCVLLVACANVANLLLVRAAGRQREIAIRTAMGASRPRLLRQLLVESVTMSALGGLVGLVAADWSIHAIAAALPPNLLPVGDVGIDTRVLLFALAVTFVTGLLFGLVPAWHAANADLNSLLKQAGRSSTGGSRPLVRNGLAAAELALATVLLVGAGLLAQSLLKLQRVTLGFDPHDVLTFQVSPPATKYPGNTRLAFYQRLIEALETIPGTDGAAVSSGVPFGLGNYTTSPVAGDIGSILPVGTSLAIDWRLVVGGYFRAMRIPLLRGRDFAPADGPDAPSVVIVSQTTARRFWGDQDPIGRALRRVADNKPFTVIGVVGDVRSTALNQESPAIYYSGYTRAAPTMDVVVRTAGTPGGILTAVRERVRALDAELPISNVRTMDEWVAGGAAQPRLNAALLGFFAVVALVIASVGIYGVMAYSVTQRTREIGLRMALGAPRSRVLRQIVREGMTVGAAGIAAGLVAAWGLSRALADLVFGVEVRDPSTFVAVAVVLGATALLASLLPAGRASRVDPMVALREE